MAIELDIRIDRSSIKAILSPDLVRLCRGFGQPRLRKAPNLAEYSEARFPRLLIAIVEPLFMNYFRTRAVGYLISTKTIF